MIKEYQAWHIVYLHVATLLWMGCTEGKIKLFDAIYEHQTFLLEQLSKE